MLRTEVPVVLEHLEVIVEVHPQRLDHLFFLRQRPSLFSSFRTTSFIFLDFDRALLGNQSRERSSSIMARILR